MLPCTATTDASGRKLLHSAEDGLERAGGNDYGGCALCRNLQSSLLYVENQLGGRGMGPGSSTVIIASCNLATRWWWLRVRCKKTRMLTYAAVC